MSSPRREAAASELLRLQEKSEGMQEQQNSISAKMWEEYELTRSEAAEQAIPLEDVGRRRSAFPSCAARYGRWVP